MARPEKLEKLYGFHTRGGHTISVCNEILCGLSRGDSLSAIARQLSRSPSTISREVGVDGDNLNYAGLESTLAALFECAKRPKQQKLSYAPLAKRITSDL